MLAEYSSSTPTPITQEIAELFKSLSSGSYLQTNDIKKKEKSQKITKINYYKTMKSTHTPIICVRSVQMTASSSTGFNEHVE